jgi:DNA polymerase-3 subunit gamma/tau
MTLALYRKWRPQTWQDVVGQQHVVQTLRNAVAAERVAHAYLFAGPRGTGKTTMARLLAKAVNCTQADLSLRPCNVCEPCQAVNEGRFWDLIEIDAASNTSVDDVRALRDKINFSPNQGKYKVYIIDEVHMLSTAAFNALLKTLEEPPPHAIFILATTDPHKIPATVLSRCQRHEFRLIPVKEMMDYLGKKALEEALPIEAEALRAVIRQSGGSLRDAISLLDQIASTGEKIDLTVVQSVLGTATSQNVIAFCDSLIQKDAAAALSIIHATLDRGVDVRLFARQIVDYLRDLLLFKIGGKGQVDATEDVIQQMEKQGEDFDTPDLIRSIRVINQAASEGRGAWQPSLALEMAAVECIIPSSPPEAAETAQSIPGNIISPATPARPLQTQASEQSAIPPKPNLEGSDAESKELFQRISKEWRQITAAARQLNLQTQGLLNSCKPLGIRKGNLILGCNNDYVKSQLDTPEHIRVARQALAETMQVDLGIQCTAAGSEKAKLPAGIDSDGLVAAAIDLGGKVAGEGKKTS